MTSEQRITKLEQRVADLEKKVAAATTTNSQKVDSVIEEIIRRLLSDYFDPK